MRTRLMVIIIVAISSRSLHADIFGDIGHVVQQAGQAVGAAGTAIGNAAGDVVKGAGNVLNQAGQVIQSPGGDIAKVLGEPLKQAGKVTTKIGEAGTTLLVSGVAKPSAVFVESIGGTVQTLGTVDLQHPERLINVVQQAAAAASGVATDAERMLERAAMDGEDIAVSSLPAPLEKGVRHASGEVIREIEKKNPDLARLLRQLPTSIVYNHLRALAADEGTCEPEKVFQFLDGAARDAPNETAKWLSFLTTPIGKQLLGTSGWTSTNCRGTAVGVVVGHDATFSADNIVTIDIMLSALNVGGQTQPVAGKFLRIEVLPIGRAHAFVGYHSVRVGEAILTSGRIVRDEDGPFFELHPVDDLEVIAVPQAKAVPPAPVTGFVAAPPRSGSTARFTYYTVKEGDSLSRIAVRFYGRQDWPKVAKANPIFARHPDLIQPGWKLNVPVQTAGGLAATAQ